MKSYEEILDELIKKPGFITPLEADQKARELYRAQFDLIAQAMGSPKESEIKEKFNNAKTKKEAVAQLVEILKNRYYCKTITSEKPEIYIYHDGYYIKDTTLIRLFIDNTLGEHYRNNDVNEIINRIMNATPTQREAFDSAPNLINIQNGVLDIISGSFADHSPDYFFLNRLPVEYHANAACPAIMKFLGEILSQENIIILQEWFGFCLYRKYFIKKAMILVGEKNTGKCLGKGTPVLMYNGSIKKVEDIKVGDLLMGDDSMPRTVLSLARGQEMMYKVIPTKGDSYIVNESHILSLKMAKQGIVGASGYSATYPSGSIIDISVRDYLKKTKRWKFLAQGYRVGVDFDKKKLPIDPYFLGVWLGDGNSENVGITTKDQEIIDFLNKYAKKINLICKKGVYKNRCSKYSITKGYHGNCRNGLSLQSRLRKLNVLNNKHIPDIYKINSRKNRLKLLAGFIDTDGYKSNTSGIGGYTVCGVNERLIDDIIFLARSLGFASYKRKYIAKLKSINYEVQAFKATISGNCSIIPIKIRRKKCQSRKSRKDWLVHGIKLEKLKIDDYYGFEIDGNKKFLLGDFTVTHNTTVIRLLSALLGNKNISSETAQKLAVNNYASARLYGKFANVYDDLSPRDIADNGPLKILTGAGMTSGEYKYGASFVFENYAKIIFACNKIPKIKDISDDAYFDRWIVVRFDSIIENKDPFIFDRLSQPAELSGLLNWALAGLKRLLANYAFSYFKNSDEIKKEMMSSASSIASFAYECLEMATDRWIGKEQMHETYAAYCHTNGYSPESKEKLGRALPQSATYLIDKSWANQRLWYNVKFKDTVDGMQVVPQADLEPIPPNNSVELSDENQVIDDMIAKQEQEQSEADLLPWEKPNDVT